MRREDVLPLSTNLSLHASAHRGRRKLWYVDNYKPSLCIWYIVRMRHNVSQHAKAGQSALRRKFGKDEKGYRAYLSIIGSRGRAKQLSTKREAAAKDA